jgi:hypothetical protein
MGWRLDSSRKFASIAAALSTAAIGEQNVLPTEAEVWNFVKTNSQDDPQHFCSQN